jgi:hypothetical protein
MEVRLGFARQTFVNCRHFNGHRSPRWKAGDRIGDCCKKKRPTR